MRKEHRPAKGTEKSSKKSREAKRARQNGGGDAHAVSDHAQDGAAGGGNADDTEGYASPPPGEGADDAGNGFHRDSDEEYSSEDN